MKTKDLYVPVWDQWISKKTWNPVIPSESNALTFISNCFPDKDEVFFISFFAVGRRLFAPDKITLEVLQKFEGRRVKIYYAIKKPDCKPKISKEWFVLKRMNQVERQQVLDKIQNYQQFIRLEGQKFIVKQGSEHCISNVLYNHRYIT